MFFRLFLLFTLVPLADLILLIELGRRLGTWSTILLILGTGILGASLARAQGFRIIARISDQLARGELPAASLLEGVMILAAGLLLITPGPITDTTGFLLLVPPVRHAVIDWVKLLLFNRLQQGAIVIFRRKP